MNSTAAPYVPIVLSRGVVSVTAADNAFDTSQWLAVALVLLLDAATLLLATALFLTPLEKVTNNYFNNRLTLPLCGSWTCRVRCTWCQWMLAV
jgi:hypothetical protein